MIRHNGQWYVIAPKPYEPEKQTYEIAWDLVKTKVEPIVAYKRFFENQRKEAKVLYPSFRKDVD